MGVVLQSGWGGEVPSSGHLMANRPSDPDAEIIPAMVMRPFFGIQPALMDEKVVKRLPKTRTGKIMRRVLRKIVEGKGIQLGDLSAMDDQTAVQEIIDGHKHLRGTPR
ncbi:ACSA synthetase, partial [Polyodon spathula]|nr:ACSA synthetase [Polyodon spathula]